MRRSYVLVFLLLCAIFVVCMSSSGNPLYHSQYEQDKYVHETFFKDKRDGIFVDIGAHDGISLSNTYFFEKNLGWQGICVEPIPSIFEKLTQNRSCVCIQGCITDFSGTGTFLEISGGAQMLSGLTNKYEQHHYDRVQQELKRGSSACTITVPCFTFNEIMQKQGINRIDYLSVDTEGGEFDIIASIDLDAIDIEIIDVEVNHADQTDIRDYLTTHGYRFVTRLTIDEIYQKIRA